MRKTRPWLPGILAMFLLLAPLTGRAAELGGPGTSWFVQIEEIARQLLTWITGSTEADDPDPGALPDFDPDGANLSVDTTPEPPLAEALPDFDPDG